MALRAALSGVALLVAACVQLPSGERTVTRDEAVVEERSAPAAPLLDFVVVPDPPEPAQSPEPAAVPPEPAPVQVAAPQKPEGPRDLWVRIRSGFGMNGLDGPLVRQWEEWYSSRPDHVAQLVERSRPLLFHVVEEVERRGLPTEIVLLPIIESAYNPQAYSRAHASGIWQFIPSTARIFGLQQNWWYDGRRDIIAATSAALDYLQKLHAMFGDWELALASYNWGEGAVSRAIARNQARRLPTDYGSLAMPAETRNYVPKLQAVKNIVADPARFGLALSEVPNEPYFATVTTQSHIDVELAARFAGISVEEFRFLNPAHNKPVINANTAETIVLPKDRVEFFRQNLEDHGKPLVSWQAHVVKPGERAEKIAAKHGISVAELKHINGITNRNRIRTGKPLLVPVRAGAKPHLPDLPAPALARTRAQKTRYVPPSRRGPAAEKAAAKRPARAQDPAVTKKKPPAKAAKPAPARKGPPPARKKPVPPGPHVDLARNP
jgi:membrane-bound lytic murein transglycosylase D